MAEEVWLQAGATALQEQRGGGLCGQGTEKPEIAGRSSGRSTHRATKARQFTVLSDVGAASWVLLP